MVESEPPPPGRRREELTAMVALSPLPWLLKKEGGAQRLTPKPWCGLKRTLGSCGVLSIHSGCGESEGSHDQDSHMALVGLLTRHRWVICCY